MKSYQIKDSSNSSCQKNNPDKEKEKEKEEAANTDFSNKHLY